MHKVDKFLGLVIFVFLAIILVLTMRECITPLHGEEPPKWYPVNTVDPPKHRTILYDGVIAITFYGEDLDEIAAEVQAMKDMYAYRSNVSIEMPDLKDKPYWEVQ